MVKKLNSIDAETMTHLMSIETIYVWLEEVKDPEIPVLSLVDLGVITDISLEGDVVKIEMTPTFVGCPALDYMKSEIAAVLKKNGVKEIHIDVTFRKAWTSDLISEKGKIALKKFGLAPPPASRLFTDLEILSPATCPRCHDSDTRLQTLFGPTLCRSIYYCNTCKEAFEQFKPV
jgi:ring-1,2-phenylacetyl-CoA epoxidase subunit PaaD